MADRPFEHRDPSLHSPRKRPKKAVVKRPRMPRTLWWPSAIVLFGIGALLAWSLADDTGNLVWQILAGGGGFVVVGMIVVEMIWERRQKRSESPPRPT